MEIFLGWIILSILVGAFASSRGRSAFGYFVVSLLLSPLVGFIIVLVIKPLPTAAERIAAAIEAANSKKCPFCAETIKAEAVVCRFCGRDQPRIETPPPKSALQRGEPSSVPYMIWALFGAAAIILVAYLLGS